MTILRPAPVSTRQLSYDASTNQYVGEISSTNGFGQVYDDACDEGLTLVSAKTGHEVVFVVDRAERRDGEVVAWTLKPANGVDHGLHLSTTVLLFND